MSRPSFGPSAMEPLALGFANQEHPAGRRIRRLMDDSIFRADRIRWSAICVAVLIALVVLPGLRQAGQSLAEEPKKVADEVEKANDESEIIERVTGKIVNEAGKPIEDATVELRVSSYTEHWDEATLLAEQKLLTDELGNFELEVRKEVEEGRRISFHAFVESDGYFKRTFSENIPPDSESVAEGVFELPAFTIFRGMRIKGRVVAPDTQSDDSIDASVTFQASYKIGTDRGGNPRTDFFYASLNCDSEGNYSGIVPASCTLTVDASAENYASNQVEIELEPREHMDADEITASEITASKIEERELEKIRLQHGVTVFGTASRLDGRPAAGVVVGIIEGEKDSGDYIDLSAAKTDSKGRFRLPPHTGTCIIGVFETCRGRKVIDGNDELFRSDGEVPLFDTVFVDLTEKHREFELNLTKAEAVVLSGVVQFPDGKPVSGITIYRGWQSEFGPFEFEYLQPDKDGSYSCSYPKGRTPILTFADYHTSDEWWEPLLKEPLSDDADMLFENPLVRKNQELEFKPATTSVANLDWVMTKPQSSILQRVEAFAKWWFTWD